MEPKFIIFLISRTNEKMDRSIILELKKYGITDLVPSHGDILYVLHFLNTRLTMNEIATAINRSKPTVTILTKKLERSGYIKKTLNESDNRSYYIELTEKGKKFIPLLITISEKLIKKIYTDINKQQQMTLMEMLSTINRNL
jgi:DNA-binding MarR family transcriptional regulator